MGCNKTDKTLTLIDILFSADMKRIELQFKGDWTESEIIGIFTRKSEIEKVDKITLLKAGTITKF